MSSALPASRVTEETVRHVRRRIGPYEVEGEIGRGSSGTVFLGRDLENGRVAALKTLSPKLTAERERLEVYRHSLLGRDHESGLSSHSGVVEVYDVLEHDLDIRDAEGGRGRVSIAMEYVEGTDLASRLADPEPLPFEFIARAVSDVAAVLDHVHALGVVHRDIKPSNILLSAEGSVRVTDFGIAALAGEDLAEDLARLGSPNYLAPERVLGLETDHRVDVYALGAVLYEMLTRQPPYSGDSVAELLQNIAAGTTGGKLVAVSKLRPHGHRELDRIVGKALERDLEKRYQSAGELAADLEKFVARQAERSSTVPTPLVGEEADVTDPSAPASAAVPEAVLDETLLENELPLLEPRPKPVVAAARTPSRWRWVLVPVVLGLLVAGGLFVLSTTVASEPADGAGPAVQVTAMPGNSEYLSLLEESRRLYAAGEPEAAAKMLRRAEELSPDRKRIQRMRETARAEVLSERAALQEAEALDRLEEARELMDRGRLLEAQRELSGALELAPAHPEAEALAAELRRLRSQRANRLAQAARPVQPERTERESPVPSPPPVVRSDSLTLPANGDLRVDFYSESPRGVLTVYVNGTQVVNRQFRFVEKRSLLRRRGRSGGFDERVRLPAGDLSVRVYLSLPGRPAQMETLSGNLPGGSLRTLRARVDDKGGLRVEFH